MHKCRCCFVSVVLWCSIEAGSSVALLLLLLCALQAQLPPLHHTWSDMAGHQKINLFPLHLFKIQLICCLPIRGLAFRGEPMGGFQAVRPRPIPSCILMWPIFIKVPLHFQILLIYDIWGGSQQEAYVCRKTLKSVSGGLARDFRYGIITDSSVAEKRWRATVKSLYAAAPFLMCATLENTRDFV